MRSPILKHAVLRATLLLFLAATMGWAADEPDQKPSWINTYGKSSVQTGEGLERALEQPEFLRLDWTKEQLRAAMKRAAKAGDPFKPIAITERMGKFISYAKTAGKYLKPLEAVVNAGEILGAGIREGKGAAVEKAADVGLNKAVTYAGAEGGAKIGMFIGGLVAPGPGILVGGILGGAAGAFAASLGYEWWIEPMFEGTKKAPPGPPAERETGPPGAVSPPPELGRATPPGRIRISDPALRCTGLRIVPIAEVEAGAPARFMAMADLSLASSDALPETAQKNVDVTGDAVWTFSPGARLGQGQAATDCSLAGRTLTATATFLGQTGAASVKVKQLPLVALTLTAAPASAPPGGKITLSAEATYKNAYCEEHRSDPPGVEFRSDPGGSIAGHMLTIDNDKESGTVVAYASVSQAGISSNLVPISIIPPVLERVALIAPSAVDVCQVVSFELRGFYSHRPDVAKVIAPDEAAWTFGGRCEPVSINTVRATWPGETIKASVVTPQGRGAEAVVKVNPLPRTSPWFPIEDVSTFAEIKVGESMKNTAIEFACEGSRHSPKVSKKVEWRSESPDILSCTPEGICRGLQVGTATLTLYYGGKEITSRPVTVLEGGSEYEAGEEVSGEEFEAAAAEPSGPEKKADKSGEAKKESPGFKFGERIWRFLAQDVVAKALDKASHKAGETAKGTGKPPEAPKPSSNDPFVGSWRSDYYRIVGHSGGPDQEGTDEANRMAASVSIPMSIQAAGQGYSVSNLDFTVNKVTTSGSTITIAGRETAGKTDELLQLTLKGNSLVGTWRTTFDPDLLGRREWQVAEVSFSRR